MVVGAWLKRYTPGSRSCVVEASVKGAGLGVVVDRELKGAELDRNKSRPLDRCLPCPTGPWGRVSMGIGLPHPLKTISGVVNRNQVSGCCC